MNIYPAIEIKGGRCMRPGQGRCGNGVTLTEDPVERALRCRGAGARWLHVVDIDGVQRGAPDPDNLQLLRRIVQDVGLPVQASGGICSEGTATRAREIGVARFVVGTDIARDPALARRLFAEHGEHAVIGVDIRDGYVSVQGWQEHLGEPVLQFVPRMAELGARRLILHDIARDGMFQGVNIEALMQVAATVPGLAIIAAGGVTSLNDIDALNRLQRIRPNIEGAIVGKALYAGALRLADVLERADPASALTNAYYLEQAR
jgi:phosphoribosylformimino-5-aminoimidazole carboxamide ribotide isomerase